MISPASSPAAPIANTPRVTRWTFAFTWSIDRVIRTAPTTDVAPASVWPMIGTAVAMMSTPRSLLKRTTEVGTPLSAPTISGRCGVA